MFLAVYHLKMMYDSSGSEGNSTWRPETPPSHIISDGAVLFYKTAAVQNWNGEDMRLIVEIAIDWSLIELEAIVALMRGPKFVSKEFLRCRCHKRNLRNFMDQSSSFSEGVGLFYKEAAAHNWGEKDMRWIVEIASDWSMAELEEIMSLMRDPEFVPENLRVRDHGNELQAVIDQDSESVDSELRFTAKDYTR